MDKISKLALPLSILIASIVIGGFYYAVEVNKQKSIEKQEETKSAQLELAQFENKKTKCAEDAKKFHNEYIKSINGYYFEPEYTFNEKTGQCLYSGGYGEAQNPGLNDKSYWERVVKNVYTNETIISAYSFWKVKQIEKFWDEKRVLFNQ